MGWTREQLKAISGFAARNGYRLTLCTPPLARFVTKDGTEITRQIQNLVSEEAVVKKDEAKERRRLKVEEEKRKPWQDRFKHN